jgi:hypothetical protein
LPAFDPAAPVVFSVTMVAMPSRFVKGQSRTVMQFVAVGSGRLWGATTAPHLQPDGKHFEFHFWLSTDTDASAAGKKLADYFGAGRLSRVFDQLVDDVRAGKHPLYRID